MTSEEMLNSQSETIDLDQVIEAANPEADSNIPNPPPPKGKYAVKWKLGKKGVQPSTYTPKGTNDRVPFLNVFLQGNIQAEGEDYHGYPVSAYLNSIVNRQKGTSELHSFMAKLGEIVPNRITLGELKQLVENLLATEPVGHVDLDWRASYQITDEHGKKIYKDQCYSMMDFPRNEDGSYSNVVASDKDGEPLYAQGNVLRHLSSNA